MRHYGTIAERFWSQVQKADGCWLWTGGIDRHGYGKFKVPNSYQGAHRTSWEVAFGAIPAGLCVLHRCDNPPCVRPDHLFLGTQLDNSLDMRAKGRSKMRRGEDLVGTLEREHARAICHMHGIVKAEHLAEMFGVKPNQVRKIWFGERWGRDTEDIREARQLKRRERRGRPASEPPS